MISENKEEQELPSEKNCLSDEFVVEQVLDKRLSDKGGFDYLLKWQGYPSTQNQWEHESKVNCSELITAFEEQLARDLDHGNQRKHIAIDPFKAQLIPKKIIGVTNAGGKLRFYIEFEGLSEPIFVSARKAHSKCTQMVISFYESRIQFNQN